MTTSGGKDELDPNLSAILESIRAAVTGTEPVAATASEAEPAPETASAAAATPPARQARTLRRDLPPSDRTVEEFLADLIRPQVEAWLAAHLPEIVQQLAADEIRRLTGGK